MMARKIPKEKEDEIREIFERYQNKNECLEAPEIKRLLQELRQNPSDKDVQEFITKFDTNKNGKIEFVEFFAYMTANYRTRDQYNHDLKEAFKTFDKNNDGFIEAKELHKVMVGIGERLTFEEAQQMIHDADINGDGQINFEEYVKIMTKDCAQDQEPS